MDEHVVETVTVAPRLTAVVAQTTTWKRFPEVWRLLDEVYAFVRPREDLPHAGFRPQVAERDALQGDDAPSVEVGVLVRERFAPEGRVVPSQLPGGPVAMTTYRGDWAVSAARTRAVRRLRRGARAGLAGPRWEVYGHGHVEPTTKVYYLLG